MIRVRTYYELGLHGLRWRWYRRFRLAELVHGIPGLLLLQTRIGPGLQLAGTEKGVERHAENVNAGRYDEDVLPALRILRAEVLLYFSPI